MLMPLLLLLLLSAHRRAQGHMGLCELLEAELDIKAGLLAHPDNADLVALARKLK
jgi:hypothetical protein